MASYAWFDISTSNNKGMQDAVQNDVLIRCLQPNQRFLVGATGKAAALTVNTDGTARLTSNLETPGITTRLIRPVDNIVQIADGVLVYGCNVQAAQLIASNVTCSNIEVAADGRIKAGLSVTTSESIKTPVLYVGTVSAIDAGGTLQFTDPVVIPQSLTSCNLTTSNVTVSKGVTASTLVATQQITAPIAIIPVLSNVDKVTLQGVVAENSNLLGSNLTFLSSTIHDSTFSNVFTSNLTTTTAKVSRLLALSNNTLEIQGTSISGGTFTGCNIIASNVLCVLGESTLTQRVNILSNLDVAYVATFKSDVSVLKDVDCSNLVSRSRVTCQDLVTNNVSPPNGNLYVAGGKLRVIDGCNLFTTNATFDKTTTTSFGCDTCVVNGATTTNTLAVTATANVGTDFTCPTINTLAIRGVNLAAVNINDVVVERSNLYVGGYASLSNLYVRKSVSVDEGATFMVDCPALHRGAFTLCNVLTSTQGITTPTLTCTRVQSSNQELQLDGFTIRDQNHLQGNRVTVNTLAVVGGATLNALDVATSVSLSNSLYCKSNVFSDVIKGYTTPGQVNIEGVLITDNDKIAARMLSANNVFVTGGELVLQGNTIVRKDNGSVIINAAGYINGSNVITPGSVNGACLSSNAVTSDKLGANVVTSAHLSSGLAFTGTCTFDNIALNGGFSTTKGTMSICGATFSNQCVGLGGVSEPKYQLHVNGKSSLTDATVSVFTGLSNNAGVVSIKSTDVQSPVGLQLCQDTPTQRLDATIRLATYPACFGLTSTQPGDLVIQSKTPTGGWSKVYVNDAIVVSSSNVGVWKTSPQAPLHTSVFAADKAGLGGRTTPTETLDMVGNIKMTRDPNRTSLSLQLLDNPTAQGATLWLDPTDSTKKMGLYNSLGDVTVSAFDNDPMTCEHLRIQSVTGNIGLGTPTPIAPLHIRSRLRPGATRPVNTLHIDAESPSVLFENTVSNYRFEMSSNGRMNTVQTTIKPYVKLIGTLQLFRESMQTVNSSGTDTTMELGAYTRVVLFTMTDQQGTPEFIENPTSQPMIVPLTGPQRRLNWAGVIKSIALSSTNTTQHTIASDVCYVDGFNTGMETSNVFYINSTLKLLGIGTNAPQAALDIYSSLSSNVIAYKSTPILDTQRNLKNIRELSIAGPFTVNGRKLLDDANNIVEINDVNIVGSLVKSGKTVLDASYNLSNIASVSIKGPLYYNGKTLVDELSGLSNVVKLSIKGPMAIDGQSFVDSGRNVTCTTVSVSDTVSASNAFCLESVGVIERVLTDMVVTPTRACVFTNVATMNSSSSELELHGTLSHQGKVILTTDRSFSNVASISMAGPLIVGEKTILDANFNMSNLASVSSATMSVASAYYHGGSLVMDSSRSLSNVASVSLAGPIIVGGKQIIDTSFNMSNLANVSMESLAIRTATFNTDTTSGIVSIGCGGFKVSVKNGTAVPRDMLHIEPNGIVYCDASVQATSIKTTVIDADDQGADLDILTQPGYVAKTNVGFKAPSFVIGDQGYALRTDATTSSLSLTGPGAAKLLDVRAESTTIANRVVIGTPQETNHQLSVGGTIYCDQDIFSFSDARKKTNVRRIPDALNKLRRLRGVVFTRTEDPSRQHTGVIAQDVQHVLPEAVFEDPHSGYLSVAYGNLVGLLIESVKDLYTRSQSRHRSMRGVHIKGLKPRVGCGSTSKTERGLKRN